MTTQEEWKAEYAAQFAAATAKSKERLLLNKAAINEALKAIGAKAAIVTYSGSGDSGQIDDIDLFSIDAAALEALEEEDGRFSAEWDAAMLDDDWESKPVKITLDYENWEPGSEARLVTPKRVVKETTLSDALETYCDDWVSVYHDGYENNDGGQGQMTIDVGSGIWKLHHEDNFVSHQDSEEEL